MATEKYLAIDSDETEVISGSVDKTEVVFRCHLGDRIVSYTVIKTSEVQYFVSDAVTGELIGAYSNMTDEYGDEHYTHLGDGLYRVIDSSEYISEED